MSGGKPKVSGMDGRIRTLQEEWDNKQKEDFTQWMNAILNQEDLRVNDLYTDLRDGIKLMKLLEILTGEKLGKTKGKLKLHQIDNINRCLSLLRRKNIRVDNIAAEQVAAGSSRDVNSLLSIIYVNSESGKLGESPATEVDANKTRNNSMDDDQMHKRALLNWCKEKISGYRGIDMRDFSGSWRDGLAFNALIHAQRRDLVNYDALKSDNSTENLRTAFEILEKEFQIVKILSVEAVDREQPDERLILDYVALIYQAFHKIATPPAVKPRPSFPRSNSYSDGGPKLLVLSSNGRPDIDHVPVAQRRVEEVGSEPKSVGETNNKPRFAGVESIQPVVFSDSWECDYCTFMNIPSTRICAMCYKAKSERHVEEEPSVPSDEEEPSVPSDDEDDDSSIHSSNESINSQDPKYYQNAGSKSEPQPKINEEVPIVTEQSDVIASDKELDVTDNVPLRTTTRQLAEKVDGPKWLCPNCKHNNPTTTKICGFCFRTLRQLKALSLEEMGVNKLEAKQLYSPINENEAIVPENGAHETARPAKIPEA